MSLTPVIKLPDGGYRVQVRIGDLANATTLTSTLATHLAHVFLTHTGGLDLWPESEHSYVCELAAVILGFGVLLSNSSYLYAKGCGGVRIDQATTLDVTQVALALAIFSSLRKCPAALVKTQLSPTQREAFDEARMWTESNTKLLTRLERDPAALAKDEHIVLQDARPWLARVLGIGGKKRKTDLLDEDALAHLELELAKQQAQRGSKDPKRIQDPRLAELRALVDESLAETRMTHD